MRRVHIFACGTYGNYSLDGVDEIPTLEQRYQRVQALFIDQFIDYYRNKELLMIPCVVDHHWFLAVVGLSKVTVQIAGYSC